MSRRLLRRVGPFDGAMSVLQLGLEMGKAKDAADKPGGNRPTRTNEKSHAKPDDDQFKIDLCRHLNLPFF